MSQSSAKTIIAFDFGERRVGVAIGNSLTGDARPLQVIEYRNKSELFDHIQSILEQWQPDELVVGRPLSPEGGSQRVTGLAERFSRQLAGRFGLPVTPVDERYSTTEANYMKRDAIWENTQIQGAKRHDSSDALAAAVFLRQYLNDK